MLTRYAAHLARTNKVANYIRGEVEDTRLEAKDTKKNRDQGQGQPVSRPRTAMLEANAQGHRRKCSPKKGPQKLFSGELRNKTSSKIFFMRSPKEEYKKGLCKFSARFLAFSSKILTVQKRVMSSSRGQGNFRGLEASRSRPRISKCVLKTEDVLEGSTSANYREPVIQMRFLRSLNSINGRRYTR